ncbi:ABC transporter substrate-binding protein [Kribbella sp. NPDC050241]|uniref:ABC transporter substrate-binding protein n=1 Tax=Kribbella sp. NPDC050241 TaxID=3364115 RepID=UPI0037A06794
MTTPLNRRRFLQAGLAAGVLAPFLSACNLDPAAKEAKNSVRFSSYGDPTKLGLRSKLADQYTSSHPDVKMVFEGTATAEYWDKLATQMAGGNAPDVINIDIARIGQYGAAGALQSLEKYIPDTIDTKPFDKNLLSQGQLKGEQFGIPVAMGAYSMGYDVTVLDQLGLEHPKETWTWSDFAALANEIRQKSGKKIYGAEDPSGDTASLQIFLRGKGEDLYKDGALAFTEAALTEWFEYWAALRATGGTIPADIAAQAKYGDWPTSPLVKKQAALAHIHTPNLKGGFQDLTKNTIDITLPPRNTKDGKCGTFPAPSSYLSLNAKSQRADDAADFINWFANGEEAAKTLRLISGPPASASGRDVLLKGSDLSASEKQVLAYTDLALKNAFAPPQAGPAASTAVSDLLLKTSQDIAFKKISIQQGVPKFLADAGKTLDGK